MAVESWIDDDESDFIGFAKFAFVCLIGLGLLFAPITYFASKAEQADEAKCLDGGGAWTVTGHHRGMALVGKVLMPTTITDYGCVRVER